MQYCGYILKLVGIPSYILYDVAIIFTIGPLLNVKLIKTKVYTVQILLRPQSQKKAQTIVDFLDLINSLTQCWP